MKNILLSESDNLKLILKTYVDGSLKLVQRWKNITSLNDELFLTSDEVKILKENI